MKRKSTTTNLFWHGLATALLLLRSVVVMADDEYFNQFTVCADSAVVVEELLITCDSPGSYYYGSSKYRNSASCQGGDKAKLQVQFEILQDLNASPYISINVAARGSVSSYQLYDQGDLCALDTLTSVDGAACPAAGVYLIQDKFYFESAVDDYDASSFQPVPSIGFQSDVEKNYYDLGGANTDYCAGGTFQNWSTNMNNTMSASLRFFLVTFAALFAVSAAFLAWRYYAMKRELDAVTMSKKPLEEMQEDLLDEEDVRRIAMMGREKDLIDA